MLNVFGHLNPDSDAICSAIIAADWLTFTGRPACAWRTGDINPETRFILESAGVSAPQLWQGSVAGKPVWLVDFSELEQGPDGLAEADLQGLFDHHKLGTLISQQPLEIWVKPLGCCATVIWQVMRHESPMVISPCQAVLMLGAILSDTVALTSSTTTDIDRQAVDGLFALTFLEREAFIASLLAAKTDLSGYSAAGLLTKDAKPYEINGRAVTVAQIEIADPRQLAPFMPELRQALDATPDNSLTVLMVTNITTRTTELWFSRQPEGIAAPVVLENVMSRKKEVLPWLMRHLPPLPAGANHEQLPSYSGAHPR